MFRFFTLCCLFVLGCVLLMGAAQAPAAPGAPTPNAPAWLAALQKK